MTTDQTSPTHRGGARPGSGRKPAAYRRPAFAFRADRDVAQFLNQCPDRSAVINRALRQYMLAPSR